mmetsp:Transcript_28007/g.50173  ORF Transcript_28007/g.50173 Transcript_28007/m.50173 type:complete len:705 (-) Transcript_28007:31-2145(-)
MDLASQLITFEGEYNESFKQFIERQEISGSDFHTIAIIGCQSTGKSTLLNLLFQMNFDTLDTAQGRHQTTKGINVGINSQQKLLIIDIEGTDSQSRGEDGAAFEHMSALFALAAANILVVNMWTSEIGRYKAASVGLLKTIFEVNLRLFGTNSRQRILFMLRDFNDRQNNLEILKQQISETMVKIWKEIAKPDTHQHLSVFECFEFQFYTLANKEYMTDQFVQGVDNLREMFIDRSRNDYLFSGTRNDVPIDGLPIYYQHMWNLIKSEKDLNIPTQKAMLSNLRCNELKGEALDEFVEQLEGIKDKVSREVVPDFAGKVQGLVIDAFEFYDNRAKDYLEETYYEIRDELKKALLDEAKELFYTQLNHLINVCNAEFKHNFLAKLDKKKPADEFKANASAALQETLEHFNQVAEASILPDSDWSYQRVYEDLHQQLTDKIESEVKNQQILLDNEIAAFFSGKFTQVVNKTVETIVTDEVWVLLHKHQAKSMEALEERVCSILRGLGKVLETEEQIEHLRQKCYDTIKERVQHHNRSLGEKMIKRFQSWFTKDAAGVPRNWSETNIPEAFKVARERALAIAEVYRYFKLLPTWTITPNPELHSFEEILVEEDYQSAVKQFTDSSDVSYRDAVQLKEAGDAVRGVPTWVYFLFLALGWNEIIWILGSPYILFPLIVFFGGFFALGLGVVPKLAIRALMRKLGLPNFL